MLAVCLQLVRELDVPEGWPGGDDNHLGLLVNEAVQVGQSAPVSSAGWFVLCTGAGVVVAAAALTSGVRGKQHA